MEDNTQQARLRINRERDLAHDVSIAYDIWVNGAKVGHIADDSCVCLSVSPGPVEIQVTTRRRRSPMLRMTIAAGKTHDVSCGPVRSFIREILGGKGTLYLRLKADHSNA